MKKFLVLVLFVSSIVQANENNRTHVSIPEREELSKKECPLQELQAREDLMSSEFDIIGTYSKLFTFGQQGESGCALQLNDGRYTSETFSLFDWTWIWFHLTSQETSCLPHGSVWKRVESHRASPGFYMTLERVDSQAHEKIKISAYRSWGGTSLARAAGMKVLVCPVEVSKQSTNQ